jgi:hypothetical protein
MFLLAAISWLCSVVHLLSACSCYAWFCMIPSLQERYSMHKKNETWLRIPTALLCSKGMSTSTKLVYCYMLSKWFYFNKASKDYFESQESIASACNLSRKTTNECIASLQQKDYLDVVSKSKTTLHYVLKDKFDVYTKGNKGTF